MLQETFMTEAEKRSRRLVIIIDVVVAVGSSIP